MSKGLVLPPVIGHRGACAYAPENTLASFRRAAELGARWVELDVHLTRDGALAVIHDETLDRTTDRRGRVADISVADLGSLDAGRWFSGAFRGEPVPTLHGALMLIHSLGMGVNIELKGALEAQKAAATVETLGAELASGPPFAEGEVLISARRPELLAEVRDRLPGLPRGLVVTDVPRTWQPLLEDLRCVSLHPSARFLRRRQVEAALAAGFSVAAYTVNDAAKAQKLWSWGVGALFSDAPDRLLCVAPHR